MDGDPLVEIVKDEGVRLIFRKFLWRGCPDRITQIPKNAVCLKMP